MEYTWTTGEEMQPRLSRQGHQVAPANGQVRLQLERVLPAFFFRPERLNAFLPFVTSQKGERIGRLAARANQTTAYAAGGSSGAGRPGRDPIGSHAFA
jgi:hypothetical protein